MTRLRISLVLLAALLGLVFAVPAAQAQDGNLLQNPSFEGGYSAYTPRTDQERSDCPAGICNTVQIPSGWNPWWVKETGSDANPEYKPATEPFYNRIRSGSTAGQYFTFHRTHKAGFFQQVNVPANAVVQFSIWGQAWITNADQETSDTNAPINMRIGIDPYGGTNPLSPNIVWTGLVQPYDKYHLFSVQAQAAGNRVTVFTYSNPPWPMRHNDVYWDDASLVVVGQSAAPPPAAPTPTPQPAPAPAPAPQPGGGTYTVRPGDTLAAIARRHGVTLQALIAANDLANPNIIHSGQILNIPGGGSAPEQAPPPSAPTAVSATTFANLRLRSGPGTGFQILDVVPNGTTLPIIARNASSDWVQVTYQGQTGWMAAWYTTISGGTLGSVPVQ